MKALFFSLLTAMMLAHPALAQETPDESESGLALPRMVSLRSNLINARSGPGARYPIEWVYMNLSSGAKSKTGRVRNHGFTSPCSPAAVQSR